MSNRPQHQPSRPAPQPEELPASIREELERLRAQRDEAVAKATEADRARIELEERNEKVIAELRQKNDEVATTLEERFRQLEQRLAASERKSEEERRKDSANLAVTMEEFRRAATTGDVRREGQTGQTVRVNRGDYIIYDTLIGQGKFRGGWVKCSAEDMPTADRPIVSVVNVGFEYDTGVGALYHAVNHKVFKRYFEDRTRNPVVSDGRPMTEEERRALNPMRLFLPSPQVAGFVSAG